VLAEALDPRDWRIATLEVVAAHMASISGNRVVFEHPAIAEALSVPASRPIEPVYIRVYRGGASEQ
jgi:hypothetical protein